MISYLINWGIMKKWVYARNVERLYRGPRDVTIWRVDVGVISAMCAGEPHMGAIRWKIKGEINKNLVLLTNKIEDFFYSVKKNLFFLIKNKKKNLMKKLDFP